jgi:hypothetical protein
MKTIPSTQNMKMRPDALGTALDTAENEPQKMSRAFKK